MKENLLKTDLPQILHHTSDLICMVDSELNILSVNRPFQREFLETEHTSSLINLKQLLHQQDLIVLEHYFKQYNETSEAHLPETAIRFKKEQNDIWTNCKIVPEISHFYLIINIIQSIPTEESANALVSNEFFDKISVALLVLDRFQRIIQSNKSSQSLLKVKDSQLNNIQFEELLVEEDRRKAYEKIQKAFERNRSNIPLRVRLIRATGTVIWADLTISIVNDTNNGNSKYAVVSIHDTTRHYRTEQKLAVSQTNLQALFDSSIQAHLLLSTDFKILAFNEVAQKITKEVFGKVAFIGEDILSLLPEENRDGFKQLLINASSGNKLLEEEVFKKSDNSSFVWFEMIFLPIYSEEDSNGQIVGLSFSALDISERKQSEEAIARLSMVARKTDNAVMIMNNSGYAEWINSAFTRMTGYRLEEIETTIFIDLIKSRQTNKETIQRVNNALQYKEAFHGEIRCQNKYGELYWADLEITPILHQETGKVTHFFATQRDISGLKRQAASLQHLNKSLQSEIEDRKKAEESLQDKNDELNHFIYRASHDLRGPIASLLGLHQLVVKDVEDVRAKEYFEKYHDTAINLDRLLRNLTNVTEVRGRDLLIETVNLTRLIQDVILNLKRKVKLSSNVIFKLKVEQDFEVQTDEKILRIIIQELIRNSIQYQRENANSFVLVHVDAFSDSHWKLIVTDNGIGIKESIQDYVFEIFHKGHHHTQGSGVGLYLVNVATDRLRGKLEMDSTPDQGTSITIQLPRHT